MFLGAGSRLCKLAIIAGLPHYDVHMMIDYDLLYCSFEVCYVLICSLQSFFLSAYLTQDHVVVVPAMPLH